jgi:4-diphosphocytidyl-2-C-methyl-D-erythritol kinase
MTVVLVAPAKLTLGLRITGRRHDGYHLVDAEMVSVDLHDVVVIDPSRQGLAVTGRHAAGVPIDGSNLVARALLLTGRRAYVSIDKRIPPGGGLGGGSTDAAAVLRWAGVHDLEAAAAIGADVAFCLVGGHARVRGIGEIVEPLAHVAATFTLVVPPLAVSTPTAYRMWDALGGPTGEGPNDLEPAAIAAVPELAPWRDRIGELSGQRPVLAGSGATWYVPGTHDNALAELSDEGATVVVARTVPATGIPS